MAGERFRDSSAGGAAVHSDPFGRWPFPEAKVIWAGIQKSPALDQLAQQIRENLTAADILFDPKPFVPHITLGRKPVVPEAVDLSEIMIPPADMTVEDVFLYRSERGENGMVYSVIGSSSSL